MKRQKMASSNSVNRIEEILDDFCRGKDDQFPEITVFQKFAQCRLIYILHVAVAAQKQSDVCQGGFGNNERIMDLLVWNKAGCANFSQRIQGRLLF